MSFFYILIRSRQLREVQRVVNIPAQNHLVVLERAWEEEGHLYLQMELCLKSLNQYIEENHQLSETEVRRYLQIQIQILLCFSHLLPKYQMMK